MEIRRLSTEDIEDVKSAILCIFSAEPWNDVWSESQLNAYVIELIDNKNSLPFGLYDDERIIGISLGRLKHWCEGTEYWIDEFGIMPEKQSKGLGREFLNKIEFLLKEDGIDTIVLLTERTVPAYRFYKRNGFAESTEQAFMVKTDL